ncbi:MAG: exodeoxyribonuclease VII large subunit [Planctomycetes bacterium]|nr:exodeoxyribonuclease VII large subunit [Planctomycetota bacterium]
MDRKDDNWLSFFDPGRARGPRRDADVVGGASADQTGEQAAGQVNQSASRAGETGGEADPDEPGKNGRAALTVSVLVARIKNALVEAFPARICLIGEISNYSRHSSGHAYFSLKDAQAAIGAIMWKSSAARLKFSPADGMEVVVEARLDVYEPQGRVQLYVETMTPRGQGSLELAFRQLCEKLKGQGLFDPARKVPLPKYPMGIGVVSSQTGAAIRDIARTLRRRWPAARVYLVPALVQGQGAARSVAEAISLLDASAARMGIEVIIVARGGGSLEDLWAFNEEPVARAVFAAKTPIVSGVGHEVDVTICDMVADVRAATPTAAAELASPDSAEVRKHVQHLVSRLDSRVRQILDRGRQLLESASGRPVFRDPAWRLRSAAQRLDEICARLGMGLGRLLAQALRRIEPIAGALAAVHPARLREKAAADVAALLHRLGWALGGASKQAGDRLAGLAGRLDAASPRGAVALARQKVESLSRQIESMSYRSVLARGFSVTRLADGKIIRSVRQAAPGRAIVTELPDGKLASVVQGEDSPAMPPARQTGKRAKKNAAAGEENKNRESTLFD